MRLFFRPCQTINHSQRKYFSIIYILTFSPSAVLLLFTQPLSLFINRESFVKKIILPRKNYTYKIIPYIFYTFYSLKKGDIKDKVIRSLRINKEARWQTSQPVSAASIFVLQTANIFVGSKKWLLEWIRLTSDRNRSSALEYSEKKTLKMASLFSISGVHSEDFFFFFY